MPLEPVVYRWESYPEYVACLQYSRCLGRIFGSLPRRTLRQAMPKLTRAAVLIANGIAGAHAEIDSGEGMPRTERERFRNIGLGSIVVSRDGLRALRDQGVGSRADLAAAFELLERVEVGLRTRPLPVV